MFGFSAHQKINLSKFCCPSIIPDPSIISLAFFIHPAFLPIDCHSFLESFIVCLPDAVFTIFILRSVSGKAHDFSRGMKANDATNINIIIHIPKTKST